VKTVLASLDGCATPSVPHPVCGVVHATNNTTHPATAMLCATALVVKQAAILLSEKVSLKSVSLSCITLIFMVRSFAAR
jgi:hypothetical protein